MADTTPRAEAVPRARLSPRKRQRISRGIQYAVFAAAVAAVGFGADWASLAEYFADLDVAKEAFPELITVALKNTVIYTLSAYVVGFVLGLVVALMRLSSVAVYRGVALVYIEVFRGLPALVVFLIFGFGLPVAFPGLEFPFEQYGTVAVALGLVAAAYMAETFRAGIQAVPNGQLEAARSLGMPQTRAMVSIIIPQALRVVIPPLTNELILLFKDSSLVFVLGVTSLTTELSKFGGDLAAEHADSTPLVLAGAAYLVITVPLGYVVRRLEAKQRKAR
ncbi:amino acid ABC transporter permease [Actinokineospora iranica]|uniref:Polar amino acid transport system permease protein n=1 Tax=Actinokineospora iranica TaxID=1271860 RepID=A0A1G6Q3D9_9PSEU|nr:amino acid ABC transporter permease [Actinokineospora iranica]SDC86454.1 polar amino acid transport system permease protein [Actinokineospora iranica]